MISSATTQPEQTTENTAGELSVVFTKQEWRELYNAIMHFPDDAQFERIYRGLKKERG